MAFSSVLKKIKESELIRLNLNGKTIALRVKLFNAQKYEAAAPSAPIVNGILDSTNIECFDYYDFTVDTVAGDADAKNFVQKVQKTCRAEDLIVDETGMARTQEEINNGFDVQELKSEQVKDVFHRLKLCYDAKHS